MTATGHCAPAMPGYQTKVERIAIAGGADLQMYSLLDRQQYADPQGDALRQGISSATWPLFGLLWPSGAQLASRMQQHVPAQQQRVLEIGCGLGLASLVAHRRGIDMTASDCHPLTAAFLLENLRLNKLPAMKYRHGHWQDDALPRADQQPQAERVLDGRFDLLIGSDLLYERDPQGALAAFIGRHSAPAAEVWIVDPDRGNRAGFNRHMALLGFELSEQRLDQPAHAGLPGYKGRLMTYSRLAGSP
jgi:predicted nicotinamide N-methyase